MNRTQQQYGILGNIYKSIPVNISNQLNSIRTNKEALISSPQLFTTSFVDLGVPIDCVGFNNLAIWIKIDINDSLNARIRALGKFAIDDVDEYFFPIKTVSSSDIKVETEYVEFNIDQDQSYVINYSINNVIPYVQFQISVGTLGAIPGSILSAYITRSF